MWIVIILFLVLLYLSRSIIGNWIVNRYAKHLWNDPGFNKIKNETEADAAEAEAVIQSVCENTAKIILKDTDMQWLQKSINEAQDVDRGIAIHLMRLQVKKLYNVDWETAAETVRNGLWSGKMPFVPLDTKEFALTRQMLKVTERS